MGLLWRFFENLSVRAERKGSSWNCCVSGRAAVEGGFKQLLWTLRRDRNSDQKNSKHSPRRTKGPRRWHWKQRTHSMVKRVCHPVELVRGPWRHPPPQPMIMRGWGSELTWKAKAGEEQAVQGRTMRRYTGKEVTKYGKKNTNVVRGRGGVFKKHF